MYGIFIVENHLLSVSHYQRFIRYQKKKENLLASQLFSQGSDDDNERWTFIKSMEQRWVRFRLD
jgi:hypothetical protein